MTERNPPFWRRWIGATLDILWGVHSGIPMCCIIAWVNNESEPDPPDECYYAPCRQCAKDIRAGRAGAIEVEDCSRRAWTCRYLSRLTHLMLPDDPSARDVCDFCGRRAWIDYMVLFEPYPGRVGECQWCFRDRATGFDLATGEPVTITDRDGVFAFARARGIYLNGDPELAKLKDAA